MKLKKTLIVIMAALMVSSVISPAAFAATESTEVISQTIAGSEDVKSAENILPASALEVASGNETEISTDSETLSLSKFDHSTISDFLDSNGAFKSNFNEIFDEKIGSVNRDNREKIALNNQEITLYFSFEDPDAAMENIKTVLPNYISYLQSTYDLEELNSNTYEQYSSVVYGKAGETNENFILAVFLDIYDNTADNQTIINLVGDIQSSLSSRGSDADQEILYRQVYHLVPDTDENQAFLNAYSDEINSNISPRLSFNMQSGISYAIKYANSPNPDYRYISGGDCTNFLSQILWAGGYRKLTWWYPEWNPVWGYSDEWYTINSFVREVVQMKNKTKGIYQFSTDISKGSFIALDYSGDGGWDHGGFVVDKQTTLNNRGFYHFKVAQHTGNYCDWTSAGASGWVEGSGVNYFGTFSPKL